jgi:hypothetical protein
MSVVKALEHASMRCGRNLQLHVRSFTSFDEKEADSIVGRFVKPGTSGPDGRPC